VTGAVVPAQTACTKNLKTFWLAMLSQCCLWPASDSSAVRCDDKCWVLAGEHRVVYVCSVAVRAQHVDAGEAREKLLGVSARAARPMHS
jgi:hypothetical protein